MSNPNNESYYNTLSLEGLELSETEAKAAAQETLIKAIFKANPKLKISPSQIQRIVSVKYDHKWPLTSIRRAMSNLTKSDYLEKVDIKLFNVKGVYGKPEHAWIVKQKPVIVSQPELFPHPIEGLNLQVHDSRQTIQ